MTVLQLANAGDDVLLFYNDHAFPTLVQLMKMEKGDKTGVWCVCVFVGVGGVFGLTYLSDAGPEVCKHCV